MKISITKKFEFEAAHKLPNHSGKCRNLHGHSYKLEVTVSSNKLNGQGMVMDFGDLKAIVKKHVLDKFDHSNLNDFFEIPTAEHMIHWIYLTLDVHITDEWKSKINVERVRLYETSNSYVEVIG